jgi:hypothetical protein
MWWMTEIPEPVTEIIYLDVPWHRSAVGLYLRNFGSNVHEFPIEVDEKRFNQERDYRWICQREIIDRSDTIILWKRPGLDHPITIEKYADKAEVNILIVSSEDCKPRKARISG